MRKTSKIFIVIMIIMISLISFFVINKNIVHSSFFNKTHMYFENPNPDFVAETFVEEIKSFSNRNDVEVLQYSFLSADKIDIYTTMPENYRRSFALPNFIFDQDISVHNFEEVLNVGLKTQIYFDTEDADVINNFLNDFSDYGSINVNQKITTSFIHYIDLNFISIFALLIFALLLIILFDYLNSKKNYLIYELWGYSFIHIYRAFNKGLYRILFLSMVCCNLILLGALFLLNLDSMINQFILTVTIVNLITILAVSVFSVLLFSISFVRNTDISKRNKLLKPRIATGFIKVFCVILMLLLLGNFQSERNVLKNNQDQLEVWNDTTNLYYVHSMGNIDDLTIESKDNDKLLKVYRDLSDLNKVFIIDTVNYSWDSIAQNKEEEISYSYEVNVENEEDLYSPRGKQIMVDPNYLKRNPIKTFPNGQNVLNKIDDHEDVLNILVPQKYIDFEDTIKESYKEWFYFQKVAVSNIYQEALNKPLIEKPIKDLSVHIIYIEDNQEYFTYNIFTGDQHNVVKDPIVIIYTENVDNSVLASFTGNGIFLESQNEYSALRELKEVTETYNAYELNQVSSVYDQKGEHINYLEARVNQLILNMIVIFFVLIISMLIITWTYYKTFISKIAIKSMFGYNFPSIYRNLLIANLGIYLFSLSIIIVIHQSIHLYMVLFILFMASIDYMVSKFAHWLLQNKGELKFIKGELK